MLCSGRLSLILVCLNAAVVCVWCYHQQISKLALFTISKKRETQNAALWEVDLLLSLFLVFLGSSKRLLRAFWKTAVDPEMLLFGGQSKYFLTHCCCLWWWLWHIHLKWWWWRWTKMNHRGVNQGHIFSHPLTRTGGSTRTTFILIRRKYMRFLADKMTKNDTKCQ